MYEPLQLLICKECKHAVFPGRGIETHFRQAHRLVGKELQEILSFCQRLQVSDPRKIEPLDNGSKQIGHLKIYKGFQCVSCGFKLTSKTNMSTHCNGNRDCQAHPQPRWKHVRYSF
ncbi:hypothetical protein IMZ48_29660 [Candidatus Bathyarchaeota archaeon]|nr:hypothetical protein [Candidatus Bathyarchaeota archaeon]